ncbi:MAG: hypothetical protein HQ504_02015 [Rhodospirillaceae bacterium]|nr:hypothetical protein [Rhodospirillaceae bacterium]
MIRHRALIVFGDQTDIKWLLALKSGYRHCFVIIEQGSDWVLCNPLSHRIEFDIIRNLAMADIATFYRRRGYRVVETLTVSTPKKCAPWGVFTCVEAVKRALGIHARWIVTPWQFCRYLENNHNKGNNT